MLHRKRFARPGSEAPAAPRITIPGAGKGGRGFLSRRSSGSQVRGTGKISCGPDLDLGPQLDRSSAPEVGPAPERRTGFHSAAAGRGPPVMRRLTMLISGQNSITKARVTMEPTSGLAQNTDIWPWETSMA